MNLNLLLSIFRSPHYGQLKGKQWEDRSPTCQTVSLLVLNEDEYLIKNLFITN